MRSMVDYKAARAQVGRLWPWRRLRRHSKLGPAKPRRLHDPITVSLKDLVPADHFYRHLEATLDLGFVRDWTQDLFTERGRPSVDPVVFFKLQLVMAFESVRSERMLIETASLRPAHHWYLGHALDAELP